MHVCWHVRGCGGVHNAASPIVPCPTLPPLPRGETFEALWVEAGSGDVTGGCKPECSEGTLGFDWDLMSVPFKVRSCGKGLGIHSADCVPGTVLAGGGVGGTLFCFNPLQ